MADQIPKIKSKRQALQMKPRCLFLEALLIGLCVLSENIYSVQTVTCPPSVPISAATTTEQCSFSGFFTYTDGIAEGPVSSSLYYLYLLASGSNNAAVRKVDASGSLSWMASFAFTPVFKSLSVDAVEQSVYLAGQTTPLVVVKLATSDGSIVSQHQL